ncbi:MAG: hypothetical protein N2C14_00405, partial [Planctomycetales bacterium]
WQARLDQSLRTLAALRSNAAESSPTEDRPEAQDAARLESDWETDLDASLSRDVPALRRGGTAVGRLGRLSAFAEGEIHGYELPEGQRFLILNAASASLGESIPRWIAAALLLFGSGWLAARVGRSGESRSFLSHRCAAAAAAGICWWLWLHPSFVGWLLIGLSVWFSFRGPWKSVLASSRSSIIHPTRP